MLLLGYFVITLIAVLMSSTVGTVLLLRACLAGHLRRGWAVTGIATLMLGLPIAVPLAVAALFVQAMRLMPGAAGFDPAQERNFVLSLLGTILASLLLSLFAGISGIRKLPGGKRADPG